MSDNHRFDFYKGKDDEFLMSNGLLPQTEEEMDLEEQLFDSAIPLSLAWKERDDFKKVLLWDSAFEEYLEHRQILILHKGPENYFPWKIHDSMNLNLVNGFALNQGAQGSCAGAAWRNSLLCSDLVNAKLSDSGSIVETGVDMVYAMARGNGRLNFGSGCNGTPLVKYGTEIGNYRTADVGKYDPRGSNVTQRNFDNPVFKANALKHQSICCYLPDTSFDTFFKACSAGLSVWIGSPSFPASGTLLGSINTVSRFTSGAHATCFTFGMVQDGIKRLFFQNSHGPRYASGCRYCSPNTGCWVDQTAFLQFRINRKYGMPFVHFGELVKVKS